MHKRKRFVIYHLGVNVPRPDLKRASHVMRLNKASDFALRILLLIGKCDEPVSIDTLSKTLVISKSNVMKIVAKLSAAGLVATQRGPNGGVSLGQPARSIRIGAVVRTIESDLAVVACLSAGPCDCVYLPRCALKPAMREATDAFLATLDTYTLEKLIKGTRTPKLSTASAA